MDYLKDTALYFQLKEAIKKFIEEKGLKPGDKLLSENELMAMYSVSRITVRKALDELERDGYIDRKHGKGTFVSSKRIVAQLSYLSSFTEDMEEKGYKTHAKVSENKLLKATADVASALGIAEGDEVLFIKRVRYADDNPIAIEECYIPGNPFRELHEEDFSTKSLNKLMQNRFGVKFSYARQIISTLIAPKAILGTFGLSKPMAILCMKRTAYDVNSKPVQYTLSYYRGDTYEYEAYLPMKN